MEALIIDNLIALTQACVTRLLTVYESRQYLHPKLFPPTPL
jgi:hypothetical protein